MPLKLIMHSFLKFQAPRVSFITVLIYNTKDLGKINMIKKIHIYKANQIHEINWANFMKITQN